MRKFMLLPLDLRIRLRLTSMTTILYFLPTIISVLISEMIRFDAISKAREWVAWLHVRTSKLEIIEPLAPRYPVEDLLSIVNPDIRKPFDMSEVLLRIVDDSRLSVFKPKYGPNIITAWAHIMGKTTILQ